MGRRPRCGAGRQYRDAVSTLGRLLTSLLRAAARPGPAGSRARRTTQPDRVPRRVDPGQRGRTEGTKAPPRPSVGPGRYPGDFEGRVDPVYAPDLDGAPDPGEIVWTWVPYEEDHSRGKDRPVLVVGHDGPWLLALMLTSRDRDAMPNHRGERWMDLGSGDWDHERRPSEVRLDRVLRLDPDAVRREGAVLDRARFEAVARAL